MAVVAGNILWDAVVNVVDQLRVSAGGWKHGPTVSVIWSSSCVFPKRASHGTHTPFWLLLQVPSPGVPL